jgi:tRNA(Ile)-lysidine synthase TilS/MesJ
MFDERLAQTILSIARARFPGTIANMAQLREILGAEHRPEEEIRSALEALVADGLIEFQHPVRTGMDQVLRDFVNMKVTHQGRQLGAGERIA